MNTLRQFLSLNKIYNKKSLFSSLCFSAKYSSFVPRAKALEALKTRADFPESNFRDGKYMILVGTSLVCVENNYDLAWRTSEDDSYGSINLGLFHFTEVKSLSENELPQKLLLDISMEEGRQICLFALDFDMPSYDAVKRLESNSMGKLLTAQETLLKLTESESLYVAKAKGLSHFNKTFKYCPGCGMSLTASEIGVLKECKTCKQNHYPLVAAVAIVLIDNTSHDEVLLVRQDRHPLGMYSCVAGFIEPGETVDKAVEREVAEEVGLVIKDIHYCVSQPWAMTNSQLMLGCMGTVDRSDFDIDEKEIRKAIWIKAEDLRLAVDRSKSMTDIPKPSATDWETGKEFWVPPSFTAAHQLMVQWLRRFHGLI